MNVIDWMVFYVKNLRNTLSKSWVLFHKPWPLYFEEVIKSNIA